jgi:GLPGLI family protein
MKKIFIFLLIYSQYSLSQNVSSIIVKYKPVIEIVKIDKEKKHSEMVEELMQSFQNKTFILKINSEGFLFEEENSLQNNEKENHLSKISNIIFSVNSFFYENKRGQLFSIIDNLNIKSNSNYDWKLLSETKKIDNYNCYKAIWNKKFYTKKGEEVNQLVTAWYSPEINLNYGPNGYMGLPGLILELEYDKTKIVAKEINFLVKELKIDFPKNKEVTEDEYLEIIYKN